MTKKNFSTQSATHSAELPQQQVALGRRYVRHEGGPGDVFPAAQHVHRVLPLCSGGVVHVRRAVAEVLGSESFMNLHCDL